MVNKRLPRRSRSAWMLIAGYSMTGPRPAGRPWTAAEDLQLRELLGSGIRAAAIARKLNRSTGAIYARVNSLKDRPAPPRSLPRNEPLFITRLRAKGEGRSHKEQPSTLRPGVG